MALNPVQNWLNSVLGPYRHRQQVFSDVDRTLATLPSLSPRTDTYTYDDGRTVLLLTLQGTIPITFRGGHYNIPVAYWLPHDFPAEAPIAYVVPTSQMLVKPSRSVDISGLVRSEYLEQWSRKPEGCNLLSFTESLQYIFSKEPPLYAKPAQQPTASTSSSSPRPNGRPAPPAPSTSDAADPRNQQQSPALPTKPYINGSRNTQSPAVEQQYRPSPQPHFHASGQAGQHPPPRPPIPSALESARQSPSFGRHASPGYQQQQAHPQQYAHQRSLSGSSYARHPQTAPIDQQHQQMRPSSMYSPSPNAHASTSQPHQPQVAYSHQPASHSSYGQPQRHPPALHINSQARDPARPTQSPLASPQHAQSGRPEGTPYIPPRPDVQSRPSQTPQRAYSTPVNILDADDAEPTSTTGPPGNSSAPTPFRPPNPALQHLRRVLYSQLTSHLSSLSSYYASENSQLAILNEDLAKGPDAIRDEMARLEAVRDVCMASRDRLRDVVETGERNLQNLHERGEPEVDELVCGQVVVHNQLLELIAEDSALEDTIYHLGRAFNTDTRSQAELEKFLKRTRLLSREQFMKRSLINKILLELAMRRAQRN